MVKFKIIKDGIEILCEVLMTFSDDTNNINYIVYTDGTKDSLGELEIYASRYELENNNYILKDIENEYEWDLVDEMLESKRKEIGELNE